MLDMGRNQINPDEVATYHCWNECAQKAFLCGKSGEMNRFNCRKDWIEARMAHLAQHYAVDVLEFAIMDNHFHEILTTRPDKAASWPAKEVAERWEHAHHAPPVTDRQKAAALRRIRATVRSRKRVQKLRHRLSNPSWFIGKLEESIARKANRETGVRGAFWAGRYRCRRLETPEEVADAMAYVALNPIRANLAARPEEACHTGFRLRVKALMEAAQAGEGGEGVPDVGSPSPGSVSAEAESPSTPSRTRGTSSEAVPPPTATSLERLLRKWERPENASQLPVSWLAPLHPILELLEHFRRTDHQGRVRRPGKDGVMAPGEPPILERLARVLTQKMEVSPKDQSTSSPPVEEVARTGPFDGTRAHRS